MNTTHSPDTKPPLPPGWRWVRLGEVCRINPPKPTLDRSDDVPTTFVPMTAVSAETGRIEKPEVRPFAQVRKGYTYFEEGDVLFAKITPCMQNGKHAVARDLIGGFGFGTTEFHVLRPTGEVLAEWVHAFLRQPAVLEAAAENFAGTVGQQRLPEEYLAALPIPLPPLAEQERLVGVLRERLGAVARARRAAEEQLAAARALPAAYLRAVFNSPEAQSWPKKRLGEVCRQDRRIVEPCSPLPYLSLEHVEAQTGRILKDPANPVEDEGKSTTFAFDTRHVLYGKLRPYLNKVALPDFAGRCTTEMIPLLPTELVIREFLAWALRRPEVVEAAMREKTGSRMPRADMDELMKLEIPLPPLSEQERIVGVLRERLEAVARARRAAEEQLAAIEALPSALLRQAFQGEL